jgi:hypothetical protein
MLPWLTLPASLLEMLAVLRPCFTAPGFVTFCGLAAGLAGRVRRRTVVGMLLGGCLQHAWPHDRAHYFFARARRELDQLGLAVAQLVVLLLVPPGADLRVAVPQPNSMLRRPSRSTGSTPACASAIPQIPQLGSAAAPLRKPGPAYSSAHLSHAARLRGT